MKYPVSKLDMPSGFVVSTTTGRWSGRFEPPRWHRRARTGVLSYIAAALAMMLSLLVIGVGRKHGWL